MVNDLPKYCTNCGKDNDDNSTFCRNCGKRLSGIHSTNSDKISVKNENNKILIGIIVVLLMVIAIIGSYAYVTLNNPDETSDSHNDSSIKNISDNSVNNVTNMNTKSWHKIGSFSGVGDDTIIVTSGKNRIKVVSSAMPIKNYADNYMFTTVTKNGHSIGSSDLSWNSKSAVASKSKTIEFSGSGTYYVYVSAYELQYWNLEVYEYY